MRKRIERNAKNSCQQHIWNHSPDRSSAYLEKEEPTESQKNIHDLMAILKNNTNKNIRTHAMRRSAHE